MVLYILCWCVLANGKQLNGKPHTLSTTYCSRSPHSCTGCTPPVHVTFRLTGKICYQKPHPWSAEQQILLPAVFFYRALLQWSTSVVYFNRVNRLWNFLPPIDLNLSLPTIRRNLKRTYWKHFETSFKSSDHCSFHLLCPCNRCRVTPSFLLFIVDHRHDFTQQ